MVLNTFWPVLMYSVKRRYDTSKRYRTNNNNNKIILKIINIIGIPKTICSDQGSECKKNTFQKLLDEHSI